MVVWTVGKDGEMEDLKTIGVGSESGGSKGMKRIRLEAVKEGEISVSLVVQGRSLHCPVRVIQSSCLLSDLMELTEDDQHQILVPDWISLQIMQDVVEIVEKGDTGECAHLVLVSLSYLLDFLIAVDFLGCLDLKATVEQRIKDRINEANWRGVYDYTKDIIGLFNTTRHAIEFVDKKLVEGSAPKIEENPPVSIDCRE